MVDDPQQGSIAGTTGARLTALLAVIYGLGIAFLPKGNDTFDRAWLYGGAVIVGVPFVAFMVIPFLRSLFGRGPG